VAGKTEEATVHVLRGAVAALVWSLLVVAVAAGTWFVVRAAGRDVGGSGGLGGPVDLPGPVPAASSASPTASAGPLPSASGATTPGTGPTPSPSFSPSPTGPVVKGTTTYHKAESGDVVVHCKGAVIGSWSVRPDVGWLPVATQTSPATLEATFSHPDGRRTAVSAVCRASDPNPEFTPVAVAPSPAPSPSAPTSPSTTS
jgi:hypothetical protein